VAVAAVAAMLLLAKLAVAQSPTPSSDAPALNCANSQPYDADRGVCDCNMVRTATATDGLKGTKP